MTERTDAEEALDDALISANAVASVIGMADTRRPFVEEILNKIPIEMMERIKVVVVKLHLCAELASIRPFFTSSVEGQTTRSGLTLPPRRP
jgi:hypothetical protein